MFYAMSDTDVANRYQAMRCPYQEGGFLYLMSQRIRQVRRCLIRQVGTDMVYAVCLHPRHAMSGGMDTQ
eukprot:3936679-Rhodomonas_salina.1